MVESVASEVFVRNLAGTVGEDQWFKALEVVRPVPAARFPAWTAISSITAGSGYNITVSEHIGIHVIGDPIARTESTSLDLKGGAHNSENHGSQRRGCLGSTTIIGVWARGFILRRQTK